MARMTGRKTTLVRELADVCAARYRDAWQRALSPQERKAARLSLKSVRAEAAAAFGNRCAWCGLPQERPHRDHFPPLVIDRMWTGYTMDVRVPSCAADNRQYSDWQTHLDTCWKSDDHDMKERHRVALQHLLTLQQAVPKAVYEDAFVSLRDELDAVLVKADNRVSELAGDWFQQHPYEAKAAVAKLNDDNPPAR